MPAIDVKELERMIAVGFHWLMVTGARATTVQPLTEDGYEALCTMLRAAGVADELLARLGQRLDGRYYAALPLEHGADTLAAVLTASDIPGVRLDA